MSKIEEAVNILVDMGLPSEQQNERSGLTLLALGGRKRKHALVANQETEHQNPRYHDIH